MKRILAYIIVDHGSTGVGNMRPVRLVRLGQWVICIGKGHATKPIEGQSYKGKKAHQGQTFCYLLCLIAGLLDLS